MKRLRKQNILNLHTDLIEAFGGSHGVRDEGLLDSAVNAPFQSFGGIELYPTILEKAARLGFGLSKTIRFWTATSALASTRCWFFWISTTFLSRMRTRS